MSNKNYDATNVDFKSLQLCTAKNNILDFETGAIQANEKNFGHLAVLFEASIIDFPVRMDVKFRRGDSSRICKIQLDDWLVMLWGEIHVFPDFLFRHTFTTDELIEFRCSVCGKISGDNQDGSYNEMHAAYTIAYLDGRPDHNVLAPCNMDLKV